MTRSGAISRGVGLCDLGPMSTNDCGAPECTSRPRLVHWRADATSAQRYLLRCRGHMLPVRQRGPPKRRMGTMGIEDVLRTTCCAESAAHTGPLDASSGHCSDALAPYLSRNGSNVGMSASAYQFAACFHERRRVTQRPILHIGSALKKKGKGTRLIALEP